MRYPQVPCSQPNSSDRQEANLVQPVGVVFAGERVGKRLRNSLKALQHGDCAAFPPLHSGSEKAEVHRVRTQEPEQFCEASRMGSKLGLKVCRESGLAVFRSRWVEA